MLAIYRREVHSYFTSPIGYLLIAFLLLMNGFYFTAYNLQNGYSNYGLVLYNTLIVLLVFCPLLTMRSFSEERRQKTDQLLLCAPVRTVEIVLAKFLACVTVIGVPFALFSDVGMNLKDAFAPAAVWELCGGNYGYFPSDELWDKAAYERGDAYMYYNRGGPLAKGSEARLPAAIREPLGK